eukprot:TRINITY_DN7829_c0_g1_i3.p1 TRINITY_DN7829_c0_g1~~TRINITY_DN7829_c0_g1_i3.p1  ORF type:complete len:105 (+),score=8.10 TRINITY_DN7829_c0_g1_i3:241-555(+)
MIVDDSFVVSRSFTIACQLRLIEIKEQFMCIGGVTDSGALENIVRIPPDFDGSEGSNFAPSLSIFFLSFPLFLIIKILFIGPGKVYFCVFILQLTLFFSLWLLI